MTRPLLVLAATLALALPASAAAICLLITLPVANRSRTVPT